MNAKRNPYAASKTLGADDSRSVRFSFSTIVWWLVYLQPMLTLLLIYASWGITAIALGRAPRFGEVPESQPLGSIEGVICLVGGISLLATPFMVVVGICCSVARPFARSGSSQNGVFLRLACALTYTKMVVILWFVLSYDPYRVFYWFLD